MYSLRTWLHVSIDCRAVTHHRLHDVRVDFLYFSFLQHRAVTQDPKKKREFVKAQKAKKDQYRKNEKLDTDINTRNTKGITASRRNHINNNNNNNNNHGCGHNHNASRTFCGRSFNPLSPGVKLQILLLCFHTFLTEVVGRSC